MCVGECVSDPLVILKCILFVVHLTLNKQFQSSNLVSNIKFALKPLGLQLVCVGSCGLHTLHNSFKCGFTVWQLDKLLRAIHTLFHNTPARREDYITVTKSSVFPLSFCAHRWVENLPVVERALAVWPSLLLYMEAVKTKRLPNPGTGRPFLNDVNRSVTVS